MPRRKHLSPLDIANAFTRVVYGKTAYQVVKDVIRGKVPEEASPETLTEDIIYDAMEDVLGPDFFESMPASDFVGDGAVSDGPFIRFGGAGGRGRPKSQSAAHEYAEWFRYQAERSRAERGGESDTLPPSAPPDMSRSEASRILGVPEGAAVPEIRRAFRRLARKWHPDVCICSKEEGEEMFKRVCIAYKTIGGLNHDGI